MMPVLSTTAWVGIGLCAFALAALAYALLAPRPARLPIHRRRVGPTAIQQGALTEASTAATALIGRMMASRDDSGRVVAALERAGLKIKAQEFVLLVVVCALTLAALGVVLVGPVLGILLALVTPVLAKVFLDLRAGKRRKLFGEQLDDSLQLLAGSLRAGHSLQQALASVAREADEPTSEEFARIINETRVGRDLTQSLEESGLRMKSDDFVWITQAIAINRETGGNLAEVLDGVGNTIRERGQIRRQISALSAEGKMSALVLMVLPVGIGGFLFLFNREYLVGFTQSLIGYGLLALCVILMAAGALWLRKAVTINF